VLPIVHGLEKAYDGRIDFIRVNILHPENAPLMELFSFSATPEFYLVDGGGQILGAWDEGVEEAELRQAFDLAINKSRE
jgi:hypothetical protein